MERDEEIGLLDMKKTGLIDFVINSVRLGRSMAKGKYTPAGSVTLAKNEDGVLASGILNYINVVGIMLYLSGHTRPEISFTVNYFARYIFFPKHLHGEYLKRIGWYVKLTQDCGLILNPNMVLFKIDSYTDSDFSGMYGHENPNDTDCVKSGAVYVIKC